VAARALLYAERDARVWRRLWRGTVFSGVAMPIMFLGAIGVGLGGLVDERSGSVQGLDYLSFVAPGLLVAGAMQNAAGNALWQVMAGHKWLHVFDAAVATPLRPADVYGGYLIWTTTWALMTAVPFVLVAALLGAVPSPWGVLAVPVAGLCALSFTAPLAAFSASQDSDASFPIIIRLVVLPLFMFSGTFFPLENLPAGIRPVAWVTPLWHSVELARGATTGSIGPGAALLHLAYLAALIALAATWGVRSFTRTLTP
jgi:lipooligosaccharide transport system permease protein